ncbi:MAG: chalcone isomerase family protein [Candidatus Sedimenticola sp. (ex Thyasira tokunagai)]
MKKLFQLLAVVFLLATVPAGAKEIAGVELAESVKSVGSDRELLLNGAGIRSKFIFDIYIGALYLGEKESAAEKILSDVGAKRVLMHFIYDKVSKSDLVDAWWDGFKDNLSEGELQSLSERITAFGALFPDAHRGDVFLLDYLPGEGTRVSVNGTVAGTISGADFNQALLKIWIGQNPVARSLKEAMLGAE